MRQLFEKQKQERAMRSPSSDEIVSKVYLYSKQEMENDMKNAERSHFGYMTVNTIPVKNGEKPYSRSILLNRYQHDMYAKNNFKEITSGDEQILLIKENLSFYDEKSERLSTDKIREMSKEKEMSEDSSFAFS